MLGGAGVVCSPRYFYLPPISKSSFDSGGSAYNDVSREIRGRSFRFSETFEIVPVPPSTIPAVPSARAPFERSYTRILELTTYTRFPLLFLWPKVQM